MATSAQAAGVKLPNMQRREMHFLPRYPTPVRFAADTGLRPCELVPLRIGRLDLLRGTVRLPRFLRGELAAYLAGRLRGPVP